MRTVIGYLRVSMAGQAESGLGLLAQRRAIQQEADRRGWEIIQWAEDAGLSGKDLAGRPALAGALTSLDGGQADVLLSAKLDRLSRSTGDLAMLLDRARRGGWALVCIDAPVDTSSPMGEAMVGVVGVFAQLERRLIGERTKLALAERKRAGARLGRPRSFDRSVETMILELRVDGASLTSIANRLNADCIPTARGGRQWYPSTVRAALRSAELDGEARRATVSA